MEIPRYIRTVTRIIEIDLAPSFLVFIILIAMGEFFATAAVFGYLTMTCGGLLVLGYQMNNSRMICLIRFLIVVFTIGAFINIFIDDMRFKDAHPDLLIELINKGLDSNLTRITSSNNTTLYP